MRSDTDDDPLDGAPIGQTETVTETQTLRGINYVPDEFFGHDRFGEFGIADVEVIESAEGDVDDIRVTWEGEMTKQLPRRWDQHNEPVTDEEKQQARRRKWLGWLSRAAVFVVPLGLISTIAVKLTQEVSRELVINGEAATPPSMIDAVPVFILVLVMAGIIHIGIEGGFPGKV